MITKKDIIEALEPFNDDDVLMMNDESIFYYKPKFKRICGKTQSGMIHTCALEPGHSGLCFCVCKCVEFEPDS